MSSIAAECEPRLCARCVEQWRATRSPVAGTARYIRRVDIGGRSVRRREASVAETSRSNVRQTIQRSGLSGHQWEKKLHLCHTCQENSENTDSTPRARATPPRVRRTDQHAVSDRVAHPLDSACTPRTALRQDVEHPRAGFSWKRVGQSRRISHPPASPGPHAHVILRHLTVHVHGVRRECS